MKKSTKNLNNIEESNAYAVSIINEEGIGYAITSYCRGNTFLDPKTSSLWDKAKDRMQKLQNYLELSKKENLFSGDISKEAEDNERVLMIINQEGIGYALLHYMSGEDILDPKTFRLWKKARKSLKKIIKYLNIK